MLLAQLKLVRDGAPGEIRTPDPRIRSPMLYPAELRAPCFDSKAFGPGINTVLPTPNALSTIELSSVAHARFSAPTPNFQFLEIKTQIP